MEVRIKKLCATQLPTRATSGAAAYDLYAAEGAYIAPGTTVAVATGLSMEIPEGWKGEIYSRSGLAEHGIVVANAPGKIDSDYRGEIYVLLHNTLLQDIAGIEVGDRIAQLEINPVHDINFKEVDELSATERGREGFGSTGK